MILIEERFLVLLLKIHKESLRIEKLMKLVNIRGSRKTWKAHHLTKNFILVRLMPAGSNVPAGAPHRRVAGPSLPDQTTPPELAVCRDRRWFRERLPGRKPSARLPFAQG
jgi:hypothetical protein